MKKGQWSMSMGSMVNGDTAFLSRLLTIYSKSVIHKYDIKEIEGSSRRLQWHD